MNNRIKLHELLLSLGCPNVYYQAPNTIKYPCIKYNMSKINNKNANNLAYKQDIAYTIIVMSKNVDYDIVEKVSKLPMCSFDRRYVKDNIYHTAFTIYY